MLGHRIHGCPAAEEYYRTGRVKIIGNRLHLPTGEQIPNDGRGLGLKASLDAWLAANTPPPSDATIDPSARSTTPHNQLQLRDPPRACSLNRCVHHRGS
jgi:hypothetical protein